MSDPAGERDIDLVVARLHLKLGSLQLARAELEEMAGHGTLDDEGLVDLAEARWRTGDLTGAGDAATVALAAGNEAVVALVISAEATAAAGRPAEARRLASRALELADLSVSDVFAGHAARIDLADRAGCADRRRAAVRGGGGSGRGGSR